MPEAQDNEDRRAVRASWVGLDDVPIRAATQFISQFDEHGFYLTVGMLSPPVLLGSDEEKREQASKISFVPINPLGRFLLSEKSVRDLVEVLQISLARFDNRREEAP